MKKNIENSDMPISRPTMSAPRSVRRRKIENGISGWRVRSSIDDEGDQQDRRAGESQQRRGRAPADVDGVDDRVDEQRQARGDGHRARDVEAAAPSSARLSTSMRGASAAATRPIGTLTNSTQRQLRPLVRIAAEQHAGGAAGARDRAPHAQRAVALGALGEGRGDDRQRRRRDDRGAEALDRARGDQPRLRLGEAAGERGEREDDQAEHEHAPAAEQVGEPAAEQQEAAEGERVGVDDPGQVVAGEVQLRADRRQRDVDDRGVDHDHELRHRQQHQREVLGAGRVERGTGAGRA